MFKIALVLACMACTYEGRRVQSFSEYLQSSSAAFNPSQPGVRLHRGRPTTSSSRADVLEKRAGHIRMQAVQDKAKASFVDTLGRRGYDLEVEIDNKFFNVKENEKLIQKYRKRAEKITALEEEIEELEDEELAAKTDEFRKRLAAGETLDDILEEAFAVVREAAWRTLDLRHYDVQLMGAMALNDGYLAQMGTGEGKTLVATASVYLNALAGKGAMVITVNDYLARRDSEQMGQVYNFLGLSVGLIQSPLKTELRKIAYAKDITYVTNSELGFDYLRDHLAMVKEAAVLPAELNYCLVDEGDSVLIDEARTPLKVSEPRDEEVDKKRYEDCRALANSMTPDVHYSVNEKEIQVSVLQEGIDLAESAFGLKSFFDVDGGAGDYPAKLSNALRAKELFQKNKQYVVSNGEVLIVDEFSGRTMEGRRFGAGLHEAIECKEEVDIQPESNCVASITYQSLFRRFKKLSSMTGTAITEAEEFAEVYDLKIVEIPPVLEKQRIDLPNAVYKNVRGKSKAILNEVMVMHRSGRPVLVGTVTIEASQEFSNKLLEIGVEHEVLNADPEVIEREAEIIAQAGRKGAITIATNMAGRGTDILLGGSPGFTAQLRVREGLAAAAGITVPAVDDDFYPCEIDEEAIRLIDVAAAAFVAEDKEKSFERAAQREAKRDPSVEVDLEAEAREEQALRRIELDELMAIAASSADVYEDSATDLTREAFERVKEIYDVILGPEREEVQKLGGLHVIGTNLHDSRRVDDQLRGRSGRQGDPGSSHFFISLEDRIFKLFGGDAIKPVLDTIKMDEGIALESETVTKVVKDVQAEVERYYYEIRKGAFTFDEVISSQRNDVYAKRDAILRKEGDDIINNLRAVTKDFVSDIMEDYYGKEPANSTVAETCVEKLKKSIPQLEVTAADLQGKKKEQAKEFVQPLAAAALDAKVEFLEDFTPSASWQTGKWIWMANNDKSWQDHMKAMEYIRDYSVLQSTGKMQPMAVYKKDGAEQFKKLQKKVRAETLYSWFQVGPVKKDEELPDGWVRADQVR